MIKIELLEEFLNLYNNLEIFPFTNYEDAMISNYDKLDIPFKEYSAKATGWLNAIKLEVSENLLHLPREERLFYLNHIKDKLTLQVSEFNDENLITLLKSYGIEVDNLDYNKNTKLKELLNTSFKSISGEVNLIKFKDLNREYYVYLLNIERNILLNYVNTLIKEITPKEQSSDEAYKKEVWFKVGVLLASGKMHKYYTIDSKGIMRLKDSYTAPRVAEEIEDKKGDVEKVKKYDKVVLATLKNYGPENTNANKNIFNSRDKMAKIIEHCKENGIPVIPHFKDRLPPE